MFRLLRPFALLLLLLATVGGAVAQDSAQPAAPAVPPAAAPLGADLVAQQTLALKSLSERVNVIAAAVAAAPEDDDQLVQARADLEALERPILEVGLAFRPRMAEINRALDELGPEPKDGEPAEPVDKAEQRSALTKEKKEINDIVGDAVGLQTKANNLINSISQLRRTLFGNLLLKRYDIDGAFSEKVGGEVAREASSFWRSIASWFNFMWRNKSSGLLTATLMALATGLVANYVGRRFVTSSAVRRLDDNPAYLRRLGVAFWSTILPTIAFLAFWVLILGLYEYFNVLRKDIGEYIGAFLGAIFTTFFVHRVAYSAMSPDAPSWRLVPIEPAPARILIWMTTLAAFLVTIDTFLGVVSARLGSPLSVTIVKSLIAAILVGVLILFMAWVKPFKDEVGRPRPWPMWFRVVLYSLGGVTIISALLGYVSLAQFISRQVVVTGAWLATAYIGLLASRAIADEGGFAATGLGRWVRKHWDADDSSLDQLGVLTSVIINVLIVLTFLPYVLFQWGYKTGDIALWMTRAATGFQIGTFTFSPLAVATGLIVFAVGYVMVRWFQHWLDGTVMARGRVDVGVRNSIRMIVGYAGLAFAALIAISAAGMDLSNLAIIAGGLSLGIGFGLQNIVSNFVSGLILLVERPFKAGDWVVAGDVSGVVKRINVRATEIETFQRQTVIMPNSVLINNSVRNWTHRNRIGRIDIPINVIYGSDPELVMTVLREIAKAHPLALKNPEPSVLFSGFSETALNFEVRIFLADVQTGSTVQNDVRTTILRRFRECGITLAHTPFAGSPAIAEVVPAIDESVEQSLPSKPPTGKKSAIAKRPDAE